MRGAGYYRPTKYLFSVWWTDYRDLMRLTVSRRRRWAKRTVRRSRRWTKWTGLCIRNQNSDNLLFYFESFPPMQRMEEEYLLALVRFQYFSRKLFSFERYLNLQTARFWALIKWKHSAFMSRDGWMHRCDVIHDITIRTDCKSQKWQKYAWLNVVKCVK